MNGGNGRNGCKRGGGVEERGTSLKAERKKKNGAWSKTRKNMIHSKSGMKGYYKKQFGTDRAPERK